MSRICFLVFFCAILSSCSDDPIVEVDVDKVVVWGVLSPQSERQTILLDEGLNIINIDGLSADELSRPISGAAVVVKGDSNEVMLSETAPGVYQDTETPLNVTYGQTYFLEVLDPKGRRVRAHTTVPGDTRFLQPAEGDTVVVGELLTLKWQPSEHFGYYLFREKVNDTCFGEAPGIIRSYSTYASEVTLSTFFACPESEMPYEWHEFTLIVLDSAFVNAGSSEGLNGPNVEGGVGFFGSLFEETLRVFFIAL